MKRIFFLMMVCTIILAPGAPPATAQARMRLILTGSQVSDSLVPDGSSDVVRPGATATYSLIIENDHDTPRLVNAAIQLPPGQHYLSHTLHMNGLRAAPATLIEGTTVRWNELTVPASRGNAQDNLAGIHVFLSEQPSTAEIDQRLGWAKTLVGAGGTIKLFLPSITERWTAPPDWLVYAVKRCYQLGLRPVVRLGFANGDTSSFTRRHDNPVGQMSRADAARGYWAIGWATRSVVAGLLDATAADAAAAPDAELTVIIGNEPNLEWIERDWFIDYGYVRRADGSFDTNWLTTDPDDPTASANSPDGWRVFVRGIPRPGHPPPTYDTRLDDYVYFLGYDAATEYGRFLQTTSNLLQSLNSTRLFIAAGAIASGGGDIEGRYAYHQRHFIRRMLQSVPDALAHVDYWTTNNYPYTLPPWNNYHAHPADFDRYPLGEPFWHTEIGIDSYRGDLDYLAYLQRQGITKRVPTQALIGEVGYGIGEGWGTAFGHAPVTEELRAQYMADIFERYYNTWRNELIGVNLWQLGDPDHAQETYHMFDAVYPDSASTHDWPTHRHLFYDALAGRASRPGAGRLIITFQVQLDLDVATGPARATAVVEPGALSASYQLQIEDPTRPNPSAEPPDPHLPLPLGRIGRLKS